MKKRFLSPVIVLLSAGLIAGCNANDNNNPRPVNPPSGETTGDDSYLDKFDEERYTHDNNFKVEGTDGADPFVFRFNGKYYLYCTGSGKRIRSYESTDLLNWSPTENMGLGAGVCLSGSQSDYPSGVGDFPYAPEVFYWNGYFYLTTSITGNGHFMFKSESPAGPFVRTTDNLGKSIDGSFFVDSDEEIYFYTAGGSNIQAYKLNDDFETFVKEGKDDYHQALGECSMGGWTEGPYLLLKDGQYYMTYTGTHYLSPDYRVDYAYAPNGSIPSSSGAFKRMDSTLLSTTTAYYGLGHSSTVVGPDLDSYYIVYHNLTRGNGRNINISRLSFNGSDMYAQDVAIEGGFVPAEPDFYAEDSSELTKNGAYLLSDSKTKDMFTIEFNNAGEGKMILSYVDDKNYSYATFDGKNLVLNNVENGTATKAYSHKFYNEYDTSVLHEFRFGYKNGILDVHFDNVEIDNDVKINLKAGKVGYEAGNEFDDIGATVFSNYAQGYSDNLEYKTGRILANSYDYRTSKLNNGSGLVNITESGNHINTYGNNMVLVNEGDRATYRSFVSEEGYYSLQARVPYNVIGNEVKIMVNNKVVKETTLGEARPTTYKKGDTNVDLGTIDLSAGQFNLSIVCKGEEVAFSRIDILPEATGSDFDEKFTASSTLGAFDTRNTITKTANGLETNIDQYCNITTKEEYRNYEFEVKFNVKSMGSSLSYVGLMINGQKQSGPKHNGDSNYNKGNYDTNFVGMSFTVDPSCGSINDVEYSVSKPSYGTFDFAFRQNVDYTLNVYKTDNEYVISVNGNEVKTFVANTSNLQGILGFVSYQADVLIKNMSVTVE